MDESEKPVWPRYIELKCDASTGQLDAAKVVNLPIGKYRVKPANTGGFIAWSPKLKDLEDTQYSGYFTRFNLFCVGNGYHRYEVVGHGPKFKLPEDALEAATEYHFEQKNEEHYVFCILGSLRTCRGGLTLEINPA